MQFRAVTHLIALATLVSQSAGELIIAPRNTESKVGDSTYFNCSSHLVNEEIFWYHGDQYIYTGIGILQPYRGRFEIDRNASSGSYNLVINSVEPRDAGKYICIDREGGGASGSAELIVLDNDPECQSNIQPDGVIGENIFNIPSDEIHLTCNVTYHGNIPPQMEWKKVGDAGTLRDIVTSNIASNNRTVSLYTLKLKGDSSIDKSSYICQTKRSTQNQYTCTSEIVKVIYFFGGNTTELTVVRGEPITCVARNITFPCTSQWYHDNFTCPLSCDETITTHLLGEYLCTLKCHVRGKDYIFKALKVSTIEPIKSPLQSTSGVIATAVVVPIVIIVTIIAIVSIALLLARNMRLQKILLDGDEEMIKKREDRYVCLEERIPLVALGTEERNERNVHVIRSNHRFLEKFIKSKHLREINCITDDQRNHFEKDSTNNALLEWMRNEFNEGKGQMILECFRKAKQTFLADFLAGGGVVIKSEISTKLVKVGLFTKSFFIKNETSKVSLKALNDMDQGLSLSSKVAGDDIVVAPFCQNVANSIVIWFWCKSKVGKKKLKRMYKWEILLGELTKILNFFPNDSTSLFIPNFINIDLKDFEDEVAEEEVELLQKIKKEADIKETFIRGMAILDKTLYVLHEMSPELKIYNLNDVSEVTTQTVKGLVASHDMCSCQKTSCLYIMDGKTGSTPSEILKISSDGIVVGKWSPKNNAEGYLSATTEGNVIITVYDAQMLMEYSSTGILVREVDLQNCPNPWHAIKQDYRYIVSHGNYFDSLHRVCLVNKEGTIEKSFGHQFGSAENQLNMPYYLATGSNGCVIVADRYNNRVLLLDSKLEFKTSIVPKNRQRFIRPRVVSLDETSLVVCITAGVSNETTSEETDEFRKEATGSDTPTKSNLLIERDCRILVFDIRPLLDK